MPQMAELSEQQKKCLRLVGQGLTSKEIAPLLNTTPGVVDNYINAAMGKMGLTNRREAARVLSEQENPMVQQLHMQPEAIAQPSLPDDNGSRIGEGHWRFATLLGLPPIGGRHNDLKKGQRLLAISRIGFFAALMLIASVVIIQGVIALLT